MPRGHVLAPRRARLIVLRDEGEQAAQDRLCIAHQGDRRWAGTVPAPADRHRAEAPREGRHPRPIGERDVQMGADPDDDVGLRPFLMPEREASRSGDRARRARRGPRRKASTGACSRCASAVTSAAASCAPAPHDDQRPRPRRPAAWRRPGSHPRPTAPAPKGPGGGKSLPPAPLCPKRRSRIRAPPGRAGRSPWRRSRRRPGRGGLRGRLDAGLKIDQAFDDAGLVADFVQMAEHAADRGLRKWPIRARTGAFGAIGGGEQRRPTN